MKDDIIVYTDGACSGNPGKGGWAALIISQHDEEIISGSEKETTNNRMEPPYDTLVTAFTCSLSAVDLYSRQYLPSPVSRFARAA